MDSKRLNNCIDIERDLQASIRNLCYQAGAISKWKQNAIKLKKAKEEKNLKEVVRLEALMKVKREVPYATIEKATVKMLEKLGDITVHMESAMTDEEREFFKSLALLKTRLDIGKKRMWSVLKK